MRISTGGARDRDEGLTKSLAVTAPGPNWQSLPQDWLENAGPAGSFTSGFPQQHFARPWQQDGLDPLSARAARGASEANDKSAARHPAIVPRAKRLLFFVPSIPWGITIPRTV
jgi:hypothetical protein